jgi:hypothetical protein
LDWILRWHKVPEDLEKYCKSLKKLRKECRTPIEFIEKAGEFCPFEILVCGLFKENRIEDQAVRAKILEVQERAVKKASIKDILNYLGRTPVVNQKKPKTVLKVEELMPNQEILDWMPGKAPVDADTPVARPEDLEGMPWYGRPAIWCLNACAIQDPKICLFLLKNPRCAIGELIKDVVKRGDRKIIQHGFNKSALGKNELRELHEAQEKLNPPKRKPSVHSPEREYAAQSQLIQSDATPTARQPSPLAGIPDVHGLGSFSGADGSNSSLTMSSS